MIILSPSEEWGISLRLDLKGIRFHIWLYFALFALGILALFGVLQNVLIEPYYRDNKITAIQTVADVIVENMIESNVVDQSNTDEVFRVSVNNNVCAIIYNDKGNIIFTTDALGSSCIFNQNFSLGTESYRSLNSSNSLKDVIISRNGELSEVFRNTKSNQEMILYGRYIRGNMANYTLYVNSPVELLDSTLEIFTTQFTILTAGLLMLSLVLSVFLSNRIAHPIISMHTPATELASGNYDVNFNGGHFTELDDLAKTLNTATEKLSKVDELRKDLIANMSHDIKTPLTMIKAYAEMIQDISGDNPVKRNEHLNVILKEVDYLDHLVTDMSELAKMQSGNFEIKLTLFDIKEEIDEIMLLVQHLCDEKQISLSVDSPDSVLVSADRVKIKQVIYNFVSNAIKHSGEGAAVDIKVTDKDGLVKVMVIDNGHGIREEDLPYIWDRYYKIDKGFKRSIKSTGLGLAIAKAILDTHEANYGVISEEGKGSCFWFELVVEDAE